MSRSRAEQLIESGLWLRLSGDLEWSQRLFEEAFRLDPAAAGAQPTQHEPNGAWSLAYQAELWSLLPIKVSPWPDPFASPGAVTAADSAADTWSQNPAWQAPAAAAVNPVPDVDAEPLEFEELEPPVEKPAPTPSAPPQPLETGPDVDNLLQAAEDFIELEDPEAAMELIGRAEQIAPDHPDLRLIRERGEAALHGLYEDRLGPLDAIPKVSLGAEEIVALNLDHRAGFVLSQIDGVSSFEDLFSLSGMSRLDTARILAELLEQNVITRA